MQVYTAHVLYEMPTHAIAGKSDIQKRGGDSPIEHDYIHNQQKKNRMEVAPCCLIR